MPATSASILTSAGLEALIPADRSQPTCPVLDSRPAYRDRIPVGPLPKGTEMADWLQKGDTIEELARKLGLPPQNLKESIEKFNKNAKEGLDPDFHRGETGYDKRWAFFPS